MFWRAYDLATTALLALCGAVMFGLAIGNALLRYLFDAPLVWGEEISRYAMVWGVMIGVALAYRAGHHIVITVTTDALPTRLLRWFRLASHVLTLATAGLLAWSGLPLARSLGMLEAPSSGIQMVWAYAAIPAGAALLAIEALRLIPAELDGRDGTEPRALGTAGAPS
ncbi:TRAP-type C4-dicarboxylate transport system, small permease component [Tistlia consotensis]|uniref:TRAP transporter small permease protein n=1 Tax=Tistlia consotensis USBA 355 TaxID=560819 RepID=A0A1Y6BB87_9PROT|nr:TRAP transporter small permease [Tistlia consotensis]SMF02303.1 TRAP-type C4-dicarboxylate transport system, small permease component [Tistlia consotensis USBA 355]SNS26694.1 TRAP-type C4-dicarboxylate transport system, small permease component [Tistlia consotensis]